MVSQVLLLVAGSLLVATDPMARHSFVLSAALLPGYVTFIVLGVWLKVVKPRDQKAGCKTWRADFLVARASLLILAFFVLLGVGLARPNLTAAMDLACYGLGNCGSTILLKGPWLAAWNVARKIGVLVDSVRPDWNLPTTNSTTRLADSVLTPSVSSR